ncbi:tetratricopeptide repeat protein [bacterium]|nr:MAG: tetratricopeptide repeat protein [bacterium]
MTYKKYWTAIFAALLAALVLAVYWQTTGFELINLDDFDYTLQNPVVSGGLTSSGIREALTSIPLHVYMPVPLLSHMADIEFFGPNPGRFHLVNTLIHLFNTLLLFFFLRRATGSPWKSFFAAALWALHPLRVESVAWVAERKDLLSGFFFLAGLLAYLEYARSRKLFLYAAALFAMLLGLASKPILVVFPLVLLIVDFWPLARKEPVKKLLLEKIPFFVLSVFFSALTIVSQSATIRTDEMSVPARLADTATSYFHYLKLTFWPFGLIMEDRGTAASLTGFWAAGAGLLIIAITFMAWKLRKAAPAVTAGWCWYLAALFPVSGVVPLNFYIVADHFTYLPHVGLMIALVWGAERLYTGYVKEARPLAAAGLVLIAVLTVLSFRQTSLWKDSYTLFGYIDRETGGRSAVAKNSLAISDFRAGKFQEAYDRFNAVLALDPEFNRAHGYKGIAAAKLGRYREGVFLLKKQLQLSPGEKDFCLRLANVMLLAGDHPGAARQGLENIRQWPSDKIAWEAVKYFGGEFGANMTAGNGLAAKQLYPEALKYFREAVRLKPADFRARVNLGVVLRAIGDVTGAERELAEARRLSPGEPIPESGFFN